MIIKRDLRLINAVILTLIFTLALFYILNAIPELIHDILMRTFIPDHYWDFPIITNDIYIQKLKPIGYIAFILTIVLIILGFIFQKLNLAKMGALGVYLPIFSYFATSMGFLAGVGAFWFAWAPLDDLSGNILRLGEIILILPALLVFIFEIMFKGMEKSIWTGWVFLSSLIQLVGIVIFVISLIPWFYGKFRDEEIVDFWIYCYSRHPQYLGMIIWSYGFFLRTSTSHYIHFLPIPSLPWVITATIIIGIALYEDNHVKVLNIDWHTKTPFMLPLPKKLLYVFLFPTKLILKKNYPETVKEISIVLVMYNLIIILVSIPLILLFPINWQSFPFFLEI